MYEWEGLQSGFLKGRQAPVQGFSSRTLLYGGEDYLY